MYSTFDVRITVVAFGASSRANEQADEVRLVARRTGDEEVGLARAAVLQHAAAGAVPLDGAHVEAVGERRQPLAVDVDHGDVVFVVERLHDRGAHLARADDEDLHPRGGYSQSGEGAAADPSATVESCSEDEPPSPVV